MTVETDRRLEIRLLGPVRVLRDGVALPLPGSRKVRALLAYLAVAPGPATRSQLCDLLWDAPDDPRAELRWCLSKIRGLVDDPAHARLQASDDSVRLDMAEGCVDALEIARASAAGLDALPVERQRSLAALFGGDFLEGLAIERSPLFEGWLTAQRRRLRACHAALLEQLSRRLPDDEALGYLEKWRELAPFDRRVHESLFAALARQGRLREGEEHLASTARLYEAEGLDAAAIRAAWRTARTASAPLPAAAASEVPVPVNAARRASIAVMPFADGSAATPERGGAADALAHDVITRLAKLRSLFVIAQGSVFALHERRIGAEEAARMLDVDYVVSGSVRVHGGRLAVSVELSETRSARILWAETFNRKLDDALVVLEEIGNRIVASAASEIETVERNRAILRPPSSLDAWEAYHRGLWHMYRFSKADNERARHFFENAVRRDPTFSRAFAGLSFTHWQDAFQGWGDAETRAERAFESAGQSLLADDRDPAAHWAMGRALWLRGRHDEAVLELEHAIDLSPNFALGHYNLAFVHATAGDARAAIRWSDQSRELSPFDPMLFGMLGARAMAHARLEEFDAAAGWALKAAARPNAHVHIQAIAAYTLALAGSLEQARVYAAGIRRSQPGYRVADFTAAFRFDAQGEALFREGAKRLGMD